MSEGAARETKYSTGRAAIPRTIFWTGAIRDGCSRSLSRINSRIYAEFVKTVYAVCYIKIMDVSRFFYIHTRI